MSGLTKMDLAIDLVTAVRQGAGDDRQTMIPLRNQ